MNNIQYREFEDVSCDNKDILSQDVILSSEDIEIRWAEMHFDRDEKVKIHEKNDFMELHFQFNGVSKTLYNDKDVILYPNSQTIFHATEFLAEHKLHKDNFNPFSFFEIKIGQIAVNRMFHEEMWNELGFIQNLFCSSVSCINSVKPVTPQMNGIICDMRNNPFKGIMGESYLEAKIIELFLLQAESHKPLQGVDLKSGQQNKVVAAKEYLDDNYQKKIRIIDLATTVGTNQQTLKKGFKEMFGTTIFGYYNDLRMEMAKFLLMYGERTVAEVSDEIGYKNPQHFTVAFKKKFGVLPKSLR